MYLLLFVVKLQRSSWIQMLNLQFKMSDCLQYVRSGPWASRLHDNPHKIYPIIFSTNDKEGVKGGQVLLGLILLCPWIFIQNLPEKMYPEIERHINVYIFPIVTWELDSSCFHQLIMSPLYLSTKELLPFHNVVSSDVIGWISFVAPSHHILIN